MSATEKTGMVTEINPAELSGMTRKVNEGLMVKFINDNLLSGGAALDVRRSIVLYDGDWMFMHALAELPDETMLKRLYAEAGVRYWGIGV